MTTKIQIINLNEGEKGYLYGLFIGDGNLHHDNDRHYRINFYFNPKKDVDIVEYTVFLLKKIGLLPYITLHHGCIIVRINSKSFYIFLKKFRLNLCTKNINFMIGFIAGLIDSDGYVAPGDIVISNKSKNLLKIAQLFCKKIEINTKLWSQKSVCNGKIFSIWRLRIGTRFKYKQQYSRKIQRIYGGGDCLP
jgi:intein-encoded DNA endonuclease-like protein